MRTILGAAIVAASLGFGSLQGAIAAPLGGGVRDVGGVQSILDRVQYGRGYCESLRRACMFKEQRGEVGEGNCRRYRAECGGGRASYCESLRRACVFKEYRGEVGMGNCRRYREECGR